VFGPRAQLGGSSCSSPPFLQLVCEQSGDVDHLALEEPVELFGVDALGSLHLADMPTRRRRRHARRSLEIRTLGASSALGVDRKIALHVADLRYEWQLGEGSLRSIESHETLTLAR
jgi:hypothetical protein